MLMVSVPMLKSTTVESKIFAETCYPLAPTTKMNAGKAERLRHNTALAQATHHPATIEIRQPHTLSAHFCGDYQILSFLEPLRSDCFAVAVAIMGLT
jgi:hypothetical protein